MRSARVLTAASFAAALTLGLAACSGGTGGSSDGSSASAGGVELVKDGVLTMCTNPPYEPFEFEGADGTIEGFDVDMVTEVAKDLGVGVEVKVTPFETIQSGTDLNTGTCDIVGSGITITDERKEKMDFSAPYFDADQGLLVPNDSDLDDAASLQGKKIAVQQATTGETWVNDNGLTAVQFEDLGLQVQAVKTGQVDAAVNDVAVLGAYAKDGLKVAATFSTGEQYGLAVKKGNTALLEQVDATLERIHSDGTYDTIYTDRIGTAPVKSDG